MSNDNNARIVLDCNKAFELERIRLNNNGVVFFTLTIDSYIYIHSCRLAKTKDGDEFVSFPSYKGHDGRYYSHVYVELEDCETEEIVAKVHEFLCDTKKETPKRRRKKKTENE